MRRLFWMGVGAAAGASSTVWVQRRVRERLDELGPEQVLAAAGRSARSVGRTVIAAVSEGRDGMTERELEMRQRILGVDDSLDLRHPRSGVRVQTERRRRPPPAVSVRGSGR